MTAGGDGVARAFWERVVEERNRRGWSKTELANRTGLTRATIENLRTGSRPPWPQTVHTLADVLGIDRREAEGLAGLAPRLRPVGPTDARVRADIEASDVYSPAQKQLLLNLLDVLDEANRPPRLRSVPPESAEGLG